MIGKCNTGGKPEEEKSVIAETSVIEVNPSSGKVIKKVTVYPTPTETKTVTPNQNTQNVTPSSGKHLSKVTVNPMPEILSEEWGIKHKVILNGGTRTANSLDITIKCMTYYDGYWLALGNDSNGDLYKLYTSSPTSAWTTVKMASDRNYPVTGIACDGTNVWFSLGSGVYKNRIILCQTLANFKSSNTSMNYFANASFCLHDAVAYNSRVWLVGQNTSGTAVTYMNTSTSGNSMNYYTHNLIAKPLIKCCMYNAYPVAITADGYYTYKSSITDTSLYGLFQIASDLTSKCVEQIGDYLGVAGTKSDGTYLYYAKGTPGSLNGFKAWSYIKISSSAVTPIGLAYVNGLYVMVYIDTDGKTKYWCSTDLARKGLCGIESINSSFEAKAIGSNGNVMLVAGDEGTSISKFAFIVS